jgi:hypothetical protein
MLNYDDNFLISSFGKTTATGISELLNGAYSHDQFTGLLSNNSFDSSHLWKSQRIDSLKTIENYPVQCWISGIDFPLMIYCQVFKNTDGSSGKLYMVCSDLECNIYTWKMKMLDFRAK